MLGTTDIKNCWVWWILPTFNKTLSSLWCILFFCKENLFLEISRLYFRSSFVYRHTDPLRCSQKIYSPYILLMWTGTKSWIQMVLRRFSCDSYRRHTQRPPPPKKSSTPSTPSPTSVFIPTYSPQPSPAIMLIRRTGLTFREASCLGRRDSVQIRHWAWKENFIFTVPCIVTLY